MKRWLIIIACAAYILSPVDLLPEAVLGPFGIPDDLVAAAIALKAWLQKPAPRKEVEATVIDQ
jgi:uncharacterized membrane protein YkvA (DUF1232 family)